MSLHMRFVDEIHGRLVVRYGAKWINLWAGVEEALVKADWSEQLSNVTPEGVRMALDNLPSDAPPNVAQFKALCTRQAPPMYVPALSAPPADPARVKQALAGLSMTSTNIPQRAHEWRQRMYHLRDTGQASRAQIDAIKQFEANRGASSGYSIAGTFTPIPIHLWPPGMRADAEQAELAE